LADYFSLKGIFEMDTEQTEGSLRVEQILASALKDARELSHVPSQELDEHKDMLAELVSELRALSCNG